jgi:hypothetical protein
MYRMNSDARRLPNWAPRARPFFLGSNPQKTLHVTWDANQFPQEIMVQSVLKICGIKAKPGSLIGRTKEGNEAS